MDTNKPQATEKSHSFQLSWNRYGTDMEPRNCLFSTAGQLFLVLVKFPRLQLQVLASSGAVGEEGMDVRSESLACGILNPRARKVMFEPQASFKPSLCLRRVRSTTGLRIQYGCYIHGQNVSCLFSDVRGLDQFINIRDQGQARSMKNLADKSETKSPKE